MNGNIHFKWAKYAMLAIWFAGGMAWAQPMSPQMEGYINEEVLPRRNGAATRQNTGPSAAEVRAWEERERQIQTRIAKHKATPWHMAIAYDFSKNKILGGGGYSTQQRAVEVATKSCKAGSNCKVALVFSNACAVLTFPDGPIRSLNDLFFGIHPDHNQAAALSIKKCEAVHGKGNCWYSNAPTKHGTAFCTGYDYSVYGQQ